MQHLTLLRPSLDGVNRSSPSKTRLNLNQAGSLSPSAIRFRKRKKKFLKNKRNEIVDYGVSYKVDSKANSNSIAQHQAMSRVKNGSPGSASGRKRNISIDSLFMQDAIFNACEVNSSNSPFKFQHKRFSSFDNNIGDGDEYSSPPGSPEHATKPKEYILTPSLALSAKKEKMNATIKAKEIATADHVARVNDRLKNEHHSPVLPDGSRINADGEEEDEEDSATLSYVGEGMSLKELLEKARRVAPSSCSRRYCKARPKKFVRSPATLGLKTSFAEKRSEKARTFMMKESPRKIFPPAVDGVPRRRLSSIAQPISVSAKHAMQMQKRLFDERDVHHVIALHGLSPARGEKWDWELDDFGGNVKKKLYRDSKHTPVLGNTDAAAISEIWPQLSVVPPLEKMLRSMETRCIHSVVGNESILTTGNPEDDKDDDDTTSIDSFQHPIRGPPIIRSLNTGGKSEIICGPLPNGLFLTE